MVPTDDDRPRREDLAVPRLGEATLPSPLIGRLERFVREEDRVLLARTEPELAALDLARGPVPSFEPAGPRERAFFDPARTTVGIVTCGGLCPGMNDVVRSIARTAFRTYHVREVLGFRHGYAGLKREPPAGPLSLTDESVEDVHRVGGSFLGTSRGPVRVEEMADTLERLSVGALFVIGGDGTLTGAEALSREVARRGRPIAVVGVPKTIDNDVAWTERTFGVATAVGAAQAALKAAHVESEAAWNGVGLVKLMGRHSGFLAALATLANGDADLCLVPEVPVRLEGEHGLFALLERCLEERRHALVVVAEGAGQDLLPATSERRDASGNVVLGDVGRYLRDAIREHFRVRGIPLDLKYIDPSYTIRSQPADPYDAVFCGVLGQHAVHAAMAGRTGLMIGYWQSRFVHVPLAIVAGRRRRIEPAGELWQRVLDATMQPARMDGRAPPGVSSSGSA